MPARSKRAICAAGIGAQTSGAPLRDVTGKEKGFGSRGVQKRGVRGDKGKIICYNWQSYYTT